MSVSRREILGGAAVLGAVGALGVHKLAPRGKAPSLIVFDSRKTVSLAFARTRPGTRQLDLASPASWSSIRAVKRGGAVAGVTSWNDYVSARQWLEERGLRRVSEALDQRTGLIVWHMA